MHVNRDDFLQWAHSDLLCNRERGVLAEYMVGCCLNAVGHNRMEWDACDLKTDYGARIEVKSSAYLQSWRQTKRSTIRFDIAKKKAWNAETNTFLEPPNRQSDVYVFCVLAETNIELVDPLSFAQWQFFVASTNLINARLGNQKSLSLSALEKIVGTSIGHSELAAVVRDSWNAMDCQLTCK